MSSEKQPRTPKQEQGVYVPPARRSESGSTTGTPNSKQGSPRKKLSSAEKPKFVENEREKEEFPPAPPNCCDDEEDTPATSSALSNSTESKNGHDEQVVQKMDQMSINTEQKRRSSGKKSKRSSDIFITSRTIKTRNSPPLHSPIDKMDGKSNKFQQHPKPALREVRRSLQEFVAVSDVDKFQDNDVPYIDSHCHTDFIYSQMNRFKSDDGLVNWMEKYSSGFPKSLAGIIANFIDPSLWVYTKDTGKHYDLEWIVQELQSSNMYLGTTWGCHPHHAQKWGHVEEFWVTLENIFKNGEKWKVLAVGECGVDLHKCQSDLDIQKNVFRNHVQLAFKYNLPLVIHCRNGAKGQAEDACLEVLQEVMKSNHRNLKIHRHCYTENWDTAKRWLSTCPDVHFGFTPGVFSFNEAQIDAIRRIPLDRILLETDAPYFKPKCFEGVGPPKCSLPGMAIATAFKIAEIKGLSPAEVLRATYNNTRRVYQIPVY